MKPSGYTLRLLLLLAGLIGCLSCSSQDGPSQDGPSVEVTKLSPCELIPEGGTLFVDRTSTTLDEWAFVPRALPGDHWEGSFGLGVVADDLDGDGHYDLFVPNRGAPSDVYRGLGDFKFERVEDGWGIAATELINGAVTADWDGDGDLDLWAMSDEQDLLFRNDGGVFHEVSEELGLVVKERTLAVAWADLNLDGWLDPFTCSFFGAFAGAVDSPAPDRLFLSDGQGAYEEVTDQVPHLGTPSGCFAAAFGHVNDDFLPDLLVVNDKGQYFTPDQLWVGGEDGFTNESAERFFDQAHSGMGLVLADFDGDGDDDVLKTMTPDDLMLRNDDGRFLDVTIEWELTQNPPRAMSSWDADAWDIDHDGDLDLFVTVSGYIDVNGGPIDEGEPDQEDEVWLNDGQGLFTLIGAEAAGMGGATTTRAFSRLDLNGDGAQDLVIPHRDGMTVLQGRCGGGGVLLVELEASVGNPMAAAARVTVGAGKHRWEKTVRIGGWVMSSQPPVLHFGLASEPIVDWVEVRFPSGQVVFVGPFEAGHKVRIQEPSQP